MTSPFDLAQIIKEQAIAMNRAATPNYNGTPYHVSPAAPANRQPCRCEAHKTKDGKLFPHRRDWKCEELEEHRAYVPNRPRSEY